MIWFSFVEPWHAARAHYINGVGYYENDSAVQACTEYIHTHKNRKKYQKGISKNT